MLINKGFSFSNAVGEYEIDIYPLGEFSKKQIIEMDSDSEDQLFRNYQIKETYIGSSLKPLYSSSSFGEDNIAYKFASLDYKNTKEVLAFCNEYGLPVSYRILNAIDNTDYISFHSKKNDFILASGLSQEPDCMYLCDFCYEVIMMRSILKLISDINEKNYVEIINFIFFCGLHSCNRYFSWLNPSDADMLTAFNASFERFCRVSNQEHLSLHERAQNYIDSLKEYVALAGGEYDDMLEFDYDFVFNNPSSSFASIIEQVLSFSTLISVSEEGEVIFDPPLTSCQIQSEMDVSNLLDFANSLVLLNTNRYISTITPSLKYENNQLIGDWEIPDLLSAMYLEIFMSINPEIQLRKCANPTCNGFFDASSSNQRKIYCSVRCAQLMAKRAQRERDKDKKGADN